MSTLASRSEMFKAYKNLAAEISSLQKSMFEDDPDLFEDEEQQQSYIETFDIKDLNVVKPATFYKTIGVDNTDLLKHSQVLAAKLTPLLTDINAEEFVIVSHLKMNLFGSNLKHSYKPVKHAFAELSHLIQSNHYEGAIQISLLLLPTYLNIMFWIERCDATVPEFIFFHDTKDRFSFNVCKAGNLHLVEYNSESFTSHLLEKHGWRVIEGRCDNNFTNTSKIQGRITAR